MGNIMIEPDEGRAAIVLSEMLRQKCEAMFGPELGAVREVTLQVTRAEGDLARSGWRLFAFNSTTSGHRVGEFRVHIGDTPLLKQTNMLEVELMPVR